MNENHKKERKPGRKSDDKANNKSYAHATSFWHDLYLALNYVFAENFLGILLGSGVAVCFVVYAIMTFNIRPIWWGCIGTVILADFFIVAAFYVVDKRMQPPIPATPHTSPSTAQASVRSVTPYVRGAQNIFSIKALIQYGSGMKKGPMSFWFVYPDGTKEVACVVSAGLFVECTNTSDCLRIVASYSIDIESASGVWEPAVVIPAESGQLYVNAINSIHDALEMMPKGASFDALFKNRTILPHQIIRGWLWINFKGPGPAISLRIQPQFVDNENAVMTELPTDEQKPAPIPQTDMFAIIKGTQRDLRELPFVDPIGGIHVNNSGPLFCRIIAYNANKDLVFEISPRYGGSLYPCMIGVDIAEKLAGNWIKAWLSNNFSVETEVTMVGGVWEGEITVGTNRIWALKMNATFDARHSIYLKCKSVPKYRIWVGDGRKVFCFFNTGAMNPPAPPSMATS